MALPSGTPKPLELHQLPAFVIPDSDKTWVNSLTSYLQKLLTRELQTPVEAIDLPSISALSQYFRCSPLEVHDALRELRNSQYEYHFSKFDHPITVWCKADLSKRRNI